jgi:hypothetical protein
MVKTEQIILAERIVWLAGFVAIVVAVAAFDWRVGLLVAGLVLIGSTLDISRRQP